MSIKVTRYNATWWGVHNSENGKRVDINKEIYSNEESKFVITQGSDIYSKKILEGNIRTFSQAKSKSVQKIKE